MPRELSSYTQAFSPKHETDVGQLIHLTMLELYESLQGNAIDTAVAALQQVIYRHYHGDRGITTQELLRAARELRALTHEKAALMRQCRAEAIESLGLRAREPMQPGMEETPIAAMAQDLVQAQIKDKPRGPASMADSFVKAFGPAPKTKPPAPPKNNQNAKPEKPEAA